MDFAEKINFAYKGDLQERLSLLSMRTRCPTRQENGQRYLGPPVDWTSPPPLNSEVFISRLPVDCFEDEIYDFCSQAGTVYLLRLMINFENENRGFCFVTFASPKEANAAVRWLPTRPLRPGVFVHAEISLNNCTLRVYGLNFRWSDAFIEEEIRTNLKDVVDVAIRRNDVSHKLMVTLYFETHQKAAIGRRKLSQIANSRWGRNVKVFLWSKKLQTRKPNNLTDNFEVKNEWSTKRENETPKNIENFQRQTHLFSAENCENFERHELRFSPENSFRSTFKNVAQETKTTRSEFNLWSPEKEFVFDLHRRVKFSKNESFSSTFPNRVGNNDTARSKFESAESSPSFSFEACCGNSSETTTDSSGSSFASPIANSSRYSLSPNRCTHDRCAFSLTDGSPSVCSKSDGSDAEQSVKEWNPLANGYDVLDIWSPFDYPFECLSEMFKTSADTHKKQIEIILKEAVDALDDLCFEEQ